MSKEVMEQIAKDMADDEVRMAYGEELARMDFALALTKARKESDLTQQQLAERLGVSQAYIARLESGLANPTIGKAGSIFACLWKRPSIDAGELVQPRARMASNPVRRGRLPDVSSIGLMQKEIEEILTTAESADTHAMLSRRTMKSEPAKGYKVMASAID